MNLFDLSSVHHVIDFDSFPLETLNEWIEVGVVELGPKGGENLWPLCMLVGVWFCSIVGLLLL